VFSEEVTQTVEDHATGDPCGICLDDLERDHAFHSETDPMTCPIRSTVHPQVVLYGDC
jgi:hypothetical protein